MAIKRIIRKKILTPLRLFLKDSRTIGILLLVCTGVSLVLSNVSFIAPAYTQLWQWSFSNTLDHHVHIGFLSIPNSLLIWINDFLMAFFFFLVGMEIKRELVCGELSSLKKAILPVMAAFGGMIIPAITYSLFVKDTIYVKGWAVPMATDIAFTLGIASLLGKRIPVALKIFVTALAIIDDLGAIAVIALFYGGKLVLSYILVILLVVLVLWFLNKRKAVFGWKHVLLGLILWYAMFNAGIHATVAGVILAFMIPVKQLSNVEIKLHIPVYFIILPLFALANTAIVFPTEINGIFSLTYSWGIIIGLVIGKPLGIVGVTYFMIRKKYAELPSDTNWYKMIGAGILCGIGFTMSIFLATLAFTKPLEQDIAKIAVLLASILAMGFGYSWFYLRHSK
jgi:Na+:H+ antiporter, NhaA family